MTTKPHPLSEMDLPPLILDCPACFLPLTSTIAGVKPDLVVTPCGHLFHKACLPPPSFNFSLDYLFGYSTCSTCRQSYRYNALIQFYPDISEPVGVAQVPPLPTNLLGLPSISGSQGQAPGTLTTPPSFGCGHRDCLAFGQLSHTLSEDYNALLLKFEELEKEIEAEEAEMIRLKKLIDQNTKRQQCLESATKRQELKRKSSESTAGSAGDEEQSKFRRLNLNDTKPEVEEDA